MNVQEIIAQVEQCVTIPEGYQLSAFKEVEHDDIPVYWLRFSKNPNSDVIGAEHFSVTFDPEQQQLMGLMYLDENLDTDELPTEEQAQAIAKQFIEKNIPQKVADIEVRWTAPTRKQPIDAPHDEPYTLDSGTIITGMRVKMWNNASKKYLWVMVGKDGVVMNFEQEIGWSTIRRCRTTAKWLHDAWLKQENYQLNKVAEAA